MEDIYNFEDICPYDDSLYTEKIHSLIQEPGFLHALSYVIPQPAISALIEHLKSIDNEHDFQYLIMYPFMDMLSKKTTSGTSLGGAKFYNPSLNYTIITNHRDIVLDAAFLNYELARNNIPPTEVAIGNNLLIYSWIEDLVRLNKSFIVKRDTGVREALMAARQLSAYIHYTILEKHQSVWIAQREGRAKDSSDKTQDSLVKMLALGGEGSFMESIKEINLMPVSISYEYDPNDYLKAKEFLLRRRNPDFKKSQKDDLFSMETGLMQFKGRVHFQLSPRINSKIDEIGEFRDKNMAAKYVGRLIDQSIHRNYKIFEVNYIAFDMLNDTVRFKAKYTEQQRQEFEEYLHNQLNKVDVDGVTPEEREYMLSMMLTMYANPLVNKLRTMLGEIL